MSFVTREIAQAAQDIAFEDVPVPEWEEGGVVRIVGMNAKDASAWSRQLVKVDGKGNIQSVNMDGFMERLVIRCAVDQDFHPIFKAEDEAWLGKKSARVLKRLADVAQRLSGMSAEAVEDAAKNSNGIPDDASPSV